MQLLSAAVACDVCDSSTVPWKLCVLVCIAFAMPTRSVLYFVYAGGGPPTEMFPFFT